MIPATNLILLFLLIFLFSYRSWFSLGIGWNEPVQEFAAQGMNQEMNLEIVLRLTSSACVVFPLARSRKASGWESTAH
jgi:hypothetical protein